MDQAAYAYLLGLYLGDGHISHPAQHKVPSITITLDDAWPGVQDAAESALRAVFPDNSVCRVRSPGAHDVKLYSKHLPCLFPQHGPGKKHERRIVLADWQRRITDSRPWDLVRGLVHSDGCRNVNWTTRLVRGEQRRYEYPRYWFANASDGIRQIYTDTLDRLGVEWRAVCATGGRTPYRWPGGVLWR